MLPGQELCLEEGNIDLISGEENGKQGSSKAEGGFMEEVRLLVSGVVGKDGRKIIRVFFQRGEDCAEGILPEGMITLAKGFSEEELRGLETYLRTHQKEITIQAREVNPLRNWLFGDATTTVRTGQ